MTIQGKTVPYKRCYISRNTADYVWVAYESSKARLPYAIAPTAAELGRLIGVNPTTIQSNWIKYRKGILKTVKYAMVYVGGSDDE
jgi:ribosomal protein L7Ae-like RNA K-turn-binding protein